MHRAHATLLPCGGPPFVEVAGLEFVVVGRLATVGLTALPQPEASNPTAAMPEMRTRAWLTCRIVIPL
jgi:hypothetical protein